MCTRIQPEFLNCKSIVWVNTVSNHLYISNSLLLSTTKLKIPYAYITSSPPESTCLQLSLNLTPSRMSLSSSAVVDWGPSNANWGRGRGHPFIFCIYVKAIRTKWEKLVNRALKRLAQLATKQKNSETSNRFFHSHLRIMRIQGGILCSGKSKEKRILNPPFLLPFALEK